MVMIQNPYSVTDGQTIPVASRAHPRGTESAVALTISVSGLSSDLLEDARIVPAEDFADCLVCIARRNEAGGQIGQLGHGPEAD